MSARPPQDKKNVSDILGLGLEEPSDLRRTLGQIVNSARRLFAADLCLIFPVNPITNRFLSEPVIIGETQNANERTLELPRQHGIAQQVLDQEILFVEDLAVQPEYQSRFVKAESIQSFIAIALYTARERRNLAVLYIDFKQPRQFDSNDRVFLRSFSKEASKILQITWLLRRYQEVARIGQEINQELETAEAIFHKLQAHVAGILDISYFLMLAVYRPQTNSLDIYISEEGNYSVRSSDPLEGISQWVIAERKPLFVNHLSREQNRLPARLVRITGTKTDEESLLFIPLILRDMSIGVLSIQHPRPNIYNTEDHQILQLLGNHVALALSNLRLFDSLRRLNETGQLLTQKLESERVLQDVVESIHITARADLTILYPYESAVQRFILPPTVSGEFLEPNIPLQTYILPNDIVQLTLKRTQTVFAKDSMTLYAKLGGDIGQRQGNFEQRERIRSTSATPLRVGDESVGILFVNFRQPQRFDAPQKHLLQGLANYAAIAIKNARQFGALSQRRIKELETLQKIDRELSRTLELKKVLLTILTLANKRIPADEASILLYNKQDKSLETKVAIGRHASLSQQQIIPLDQNKGITRWVFENRKPKRVDDVRNDPQWRDMYIEVTRDIHSELDVPLIHLDNIIGIINFESVRIRAFSQADQDFLVTLSGQAVLAINNALAYDREKRVAEERQALIDISNSIISQLKPEEVFRIILEKALEVTNSTAGNLMLYDRSRRDLWMADERGVEISKKGQRQNMNEGIVGWVATNKKPLNVDVCNPPWSEVYQRFIPNICSELAVPLLEGNEIRGVLNVESSIPNYFQERDERLLGALADLAVIALQNAERYEKAEEGRTSLSALHKVGQKIISQLDDPSQVMRSILENAFVLTHAEKGDLHLYNNGVPRDVYFTERDNQGQILLIEPRPTEPPVSIERGIITHVAETRLLYRTLGDAQMDPHYCGESHIRSEIAVPLLLESELVGVLNLESTKEFAFDSEDEEVLELFAGQAVIALLNARNYARAEQESLRFRLLHQAGRDLGEIVDIRQIDQAYAIVVQIAFTQSQSQVVIRRYNAETKTLSVESALPEHPIKPVQSISLDEGVNGWVARERKTMVIPDITSRHFELQAKVSSSLERSLVVTPIQFREDYYGNMTLIHEQVNHFLEVDVELFEGLARQLALTIHRLETTRAQQEAEQRVKEAEIMSSIGQINVELAHRLGNDLGLVGTYVNNILTELSDHDMTNDNITKELDKIVTDVGRVLKLSKTLKEELAEFHVTEGDLHYKHGEALHNRVMIPVAALMSETLSALPPIPPHISLNWESIANTSYIQITPSEIVNIFVNLIMNAIDAMPGGGTITIYARNAGRYIDFEVADTGSGIDLDKQAKIFDMLYTTKESSGFGLWSARRNALANGGELSVRSAPGQGATFTLRLPRVE